MKLSKLFKFFQNEFNLLDTILLSVIFCCLLAIAVGIFFTLLPGTEETGELIFLIAQEISEWTGLIFFLRNGTIVKSKYWKFIMACLIIILVSLLFKILHYPGAMELLAIGFILLEIVYTIHFVKQPYTRISGWFKYGWICSWCIGTLGIMLHMLTEPFMLIPATLFWTTIVFFLREKFTVTKMYGEVK